MYTLAPNPFAAELILANAPALSALAAQALFEQHPNCRARFQPNATTKWRSNIESRLTDLAAALTSGHERLFTDQAVWAKAAFEAHAGVESVEELRASLNVIADVLERELPPPTSGVASSLVRKAATSLPESSSYIPSRLDAQSPIERLAVQYLVHILEGNRPAAIKLVLAAAQRGKPDVALSTNPQALTVQQIFESVLLPALAECGRMWHMNESTVAVEHFATTTTQMVISMLHPYHTTSEPIKHAAVIGSVEGNAHEIGAQMFADLMEAQGWRVIFLGANVPAEDFATAVCDFNGSLAAVSASLPTQIPQITNTVKAIRQRCTDRHLPVLLGGPAFAPAPELWRSTGADAVAGTLADGLWLAAKLVGLKRDDAE